VKARLADMLTAAQKVSKSAIAKTATPEAVKKKKGWF
jgi:hypothetical protein